MAGGAAGAADGTPGPRVVVRRSKRRRRTVSAYREDGALVVLVPAGFSAAQESEWVSEMVRRVEAAEQNHLDDVGLLARAHWLADQYLGGIPEPESVRWVSNQRARWGSCSVGDRTIRLSERLQRMPSWVVDYVIVHELAHLIEPGHTDAFWGWVSHYPDAERAKGYLLGWSEATRTRPPPEGREGLADPPH